jgi:hypothetical protein
MDYLKKPPTYVPMPNQIKRAFINEINDEITPRINKIAAFLIQKSEEPLRRAQKGLEQEIAHS